MSAIEGKREPTALEQFVALTKDDGLLKSLRAELQSKQLSAKQYRERADALDDECVDLETAIAAVESLKRSWEE